MYEMSVRPYPVGLTLSSQHRHPGSSATFDHFPNVQSNNGKYLASYTEHRTWIFISFTDLISFDYRYGTKF